MSPARGDTMATRSPVRILQPPACCETACQSVLPPQPLNQKSQFLTRRHHLVPVVKRWEKLPPERPAVPSLRWPKKQPATASQVSGHPNPNPSNKHTEAHEEKRGQQPQ
ncbi:hypothetical protein NDU88_000576 [Pleurodeles waltl]|uniref:Uncharacterized protein n=1 Tax=Pleurodeles waltl TaxID=8319 RepID=A0AAV7SWW5_PLEWA|nr:hypothetical protein NDU88_000576 [Pleurodeles waltl]